MSDLDKEIKFLEARERFWEGKLQNLEDTPKGRKEYDKIIGRIIAIQDALDNLE